MLRQVVLRDQIHDGADERAVEPADAAENEHHQQVARRFEAERHGHEFAFVTDFRGKDMTKWTYRFEPEGDGTKLTESFEMMTDMPGAIAFFEKHGFRRSDMVPMRLYFGPAAKIRMPESGQKP